ncbi:endolytic transglycosylase MltG [Streptomyces sp. NPDC086787]|uniref:endolytic transglycosylase MltG n=1 Tax=Streptomyces sp. NPDC086787 TaxID=3365759 RepID=UPI0038075CDE
MTEYGRGPGSEPWHPEDPLFGDGGWEGQQAQAGHQPAYGGQQQYPQQPQNGQYGDWGQGQEHGYGQHGQQQYQPQHQYPEQQPQHQYYEQQQHYVAQAQPQYQQGGWDATGTHGHVPYAADPGDPYGQQPVAYGGEQPDFYGTEDAYPPPEPPGRRQPEPEPETGEGEHAFFADGDDDDDDVRDDTPRGRRGVRGDDKGKSAKGGKGAKKKRRNGCACLVVVLVFGGGLGGVGYFGYQFYQNRFGVAPDYAGSGNGETVTVEIPKGAGGYDIGRKLKEAGVVESVDAFVSAQAANPDAKTLQDGVYTLQKHMSAASAIELMLSPKSRSNLIIAEGLRNASVYGLIDKRLEVPDGTTARTAKKEYKHLGLPAWALNHPNVKDPLEGFLYPSSYPVAKGQKPEAVLKDMVSQAAAKYRELGLEKKARSMGLDDPWQMLTVASLVQAEGKTHDDFRKMAEVIYNRLKTTNTETNRLLQFDSTFNYLKGTSNIHISESEINSNRDPYNTYTNKGLPPGPIGNPGDDALKAALSPTDDGWVYFVATDGQSNTEFAKTYSEFQKLKDKFNATSGH